MDFFCAIINCNLIRGESMGYINVHEAAEKWKYTERRVTTLCRDGKIIGVKKEGKLWLIPDNAPKERRKSNRCIFGERSIHACGSCVSEDV